jgi:hypothetical protein
VAETRSVQQAQNQHVQRAMERPSGSNCDTAAETIGPPEAPITAQKAPVTIPAQTLRQHAQHKFNQCPECKLKSHKQPSTCPYNVWYKKGNARLEWQNKTENNLTRRHRNDGSTETDTAASMRVWASVRQQYINATTPSSASTSATGGPAASETDACTMGVAAEDIYALLALANPATTVRPSSPHPAASPSAPCPSTNGPDVAPETPTIQVCDPASTAHTPPPRAPPPPPAAAPVSSFAPAAAASAAHVFPVGSVAVQHPPGGGGRRRRRRRG